MCGGTTSGIPARTGWLPIRGLSPRVRGEPISVDKCCSDCMNGSIPACAGEPSPPSSARVSGASGLSPRVRGNPPVAKPSSADHLLGLSPRVRGNPLREPINAIDTRRGSIPACAGEPPTPGAVAPAASTGLSPRVRGNQPGWTRNPRKIRSIPRVRGNRLRKQQPIIVAGSIPACAGEPHKLPPSRVSLRVYPRVCGGTSWIRCRDMTPQGLSPRVRGNLLDPLPRHDSAGSIPACAGEPAWYPDQGARERVYPRVCGGTLNSLNKSAWVKGLSPRVRGNPQLSQ